MSTARIVQTTDGRLGYTPNHRYGELKLFPGPWFPENGPPPPKKY